MDELNTAGTEEVAAVEPAAAETTPAPTESQEPVVKDEGYFKELWNKQDETAVPSEEVKETNEPKVEEEAKAEPELEADSQTEEDPLAEFDESPIPTDEEIEERFKRVPNAAKSELKRLAALAREGIEAQEKIGGKSAIPFVEKLAKPLLSGEASSETVDEVLNTIVQANPALMKQLANDIFSNAFDLPQWREQLDTKLQSLFGNGYNTEKLQQLVGYSEAGFLDDEAFNEEWEDSGEVRLENRQLKQELEKLKAEQVKPEQEVEKRYLERQNLISEITATSDAYVLENARSAISPIVEKLGWAISDSDPEEVKQSKEFLSEMLESRLEREIRSSPEAKHIRYLIESGQAFDEKGNPTKAYELQLDKIQGKVKAQTVKMGRALSRTFTKSLLGTRNASIANNLQGSTAPPQQPNTITAKPPVPETANGRERLEQLRSVAFPKHSPQDNGILQRMANGR